MVSKINFLSAFPREWWHKVANIIIIFVGKHNMQGPFHRCPFLAKRREPGSTVEQAYMFHSAALPGSN